MIKLCVICGKEFESVRTKKYCSQVCAEKARKIKTGHFSLLEHRCPVCNNDFQPTNGKQVYCSKKCWWENHYQKNKDKNYQIAMRHHDKKYFGGNRGLALQRDSFRCRKCGSVDDIGVHHVDKTGKKENPNHELSNLITLCNKCHMMEHAEEKRVARTAFLTTCQYCGNQFKITPYRISIGGGRYCSKECKDAGRVNLDRTKDLRPADKPNWFKVSCSNCGIEFSVPPYRLKRGKTLYCGRKCRTEAENRKRAGTYKIINKENYYGRKTRGKSKPKDNAN